ncbi:MAG: LolA-like protein, partial [Planctomycetota bacterium]
MLFAIVVAIVGAAAPAPTPPAVGAVPVIQDDAAARQLYRRMFDSLRAARTLSFDLEYQLNLGEVPGGGALCKVWLKKPNYFRLEASRIGGEGSGVLIGDGKQLWIYWPKGRPLFDDEDPATAARTEVYMTKPTPIAGHSIGHEVGYLGAGILMNILDLSTFHGYKDSLQPYVDA